MNKIKFGLVAPLVGVLLTGCFDSDDDDDGGSAQVSFGVQAVLVDTTSSASPAASQSFGAGYARTGSESSAANFSCNDPSTYPEYKAVWGASGAPEEATLYLRSIELSSSESGDRATLFSANSSLGDQIVINNSNGGTVSLADLAASVDVETEEGEGETVEAVVSTGTFNQLTVTFRNEAEIKGCITETWEATNEGSGGRDCPAGSDVCDTLTAGQKTVCTIDTSSIFDLVDTNGNEVSGERMAFSDYPSSGATTTSVNLVQRGDESNAFDTESDATFNIDIDDFTIADGDELDLTIAIDLNLLLRFEGNTRIQGGEDFHPLKGVMAGDGKLDSAYFHTSYLGDIMGVYLGKPGDVQGYSVNSCYAFNGVQSDIRAADSWMTVIYDEAGELLTGFVTPKDDAGFVVIKGNINALDESVRPSVANSDGSYDLKFGSESFSGEIRDWEPLDTLGASNTLGTENVDQTATSTAADTQEVTWHYTREL